MTKPIILHISGDYPDVMAAQKTKAISRLVDGTPEFRHVVYSINRVSALGGLTAMSFGDDRTAIAYGALPKGIMWEKRLAAVAQWIIADLKRLGITPDCVEAHKLTIEGMIGEEISDAYNVPLICDIQGYTDIRIVQKKKAWRARYQRIVEKSRALLPYAPWSLPYLQDLIGLDTAKCTNLPVVPSVDTFRPAPVVAGHKLLSVFHLDGWQNKNFEGMVNAMKILVSQYPDAVLDVYGGGSAKTMLALQDILDKADMHDHVVLKGAVDNGAMPDVMQAYAGFVMPSKSESYGLVYIEALFSGVPVLFNAKRGIAGYFSPSDIGYACDPHDATDIAAGMAHLLEQQASLKQQIAEMQAQGAFEPFRAGAILQTYRDVLNSVLERG